MYTKPITQSAWSALGAAAVAFTLFAGSASAKDVTVAIPVSTQGFDLSQPADAQKFYFRLQHAATVACTHGNRVDLEPLANPQECFEKALAAAIRTTKSPGLTQIYLGTHTLREAAARGIEVPSQIAAK
jgi:UrcA family protein